MRNASHQLHPQLPERPLALGEHAVQHDRAVGRLRRPDGVLCQLEEVLRDLGRAPHLAVQHHQRPGALRVERATMQQVRQRPDGREAVVESIQHVRGTLVQHHVLHFGRGEALRRGWGGHGRRRAARCAVAADQRTDERSDQRTEAERNPEFHGAPI